MIERISIPFIVKGSFSCFAQDKLSTHRKGWTSYIYVYTHYMYRMCVCVRVRVRVVQVNHWRCNWERIAQGRIRPSVRPLISIENCIFVFEATHNLYFNRSQVVYIYAYIYIEQHVIKKIEPISTLWRDSFLEYQFLSRLVYHRSVRSIDSTIFHSIFRSSTSRWRNENENVNDPRVYFRFLLSSLQPPSPHV